MLYNNSLTRDSFANQKPKEASHFSKQNGIRLNCRHIGVYSLIFITMIRMFCYNNRTQTINTILEPRVCNNLIV